MSSVIGRIACWTALLMPFISFAMSNFIYWWDRELMCTAVNPGGKEYVCGFGYDHITVRVLFSYLVPGAWLASLTTGGIAMVRGGVGRGEKVAWLVSLIILIGFVVLTVSISNDDMP